MPGEVSLPMASAPAAVLRTPLVVTVKVTVPEPPGKIETVVYVDVSGVWAALVRGETVV